MAVEPLSRPYGTWLEGLLALIEELDDPDRCAIVVHRMRATAEHVPPSAEDIAWLAMLVPSAATAREADGAREEAITNEPAPIGEDLRANLRAGLLKMVEAQEQERSARQGLIFEAFGADDPRRLLVETIVGVPAARLAHMSIRLGESDPFLRLAKRLWVWFSPRDRMTRYGVPIRLEAAALVRRLVVELAGKLDGPHAPDHRAALLAWAGERPAIRWSGWDPESSVPHGPDVWCLLVTEVMLALFKELDFWEDFSEAIDAGRGHFWCLVQSIGSEQRDQPIVGTLPTIIQLAAAHAPFSVAADVAAALSELCWADSYAIEAEKPPRLLAKVIAAANSYGVSAFPSGPLAFSRTLLPWLDNLEPSLVDLIDAFALDPFEERAWDRVLTWRQEDSDHDDGVLNIHTLAHRALDRDDPALCDIAIACHLLMSTVLAYRPFPDTAELARTIRRIPVEDRVSTTAVLALLRRKAADGEIYPRHLDALLCLLPPVPIAPAETLEHAMRTDWLGPERWDALEPVERQRLLSAERRFLAHRGNPAGAGVELGAVLTDYCAVAERLLQRALRQVGQADGPERTLGELVGRMRDVVRAPAKGGLPWNDPNRRFVMSWDDLGRLRDLNELNIAAGKHQARADALKPEEVVLHRQAFMFGGLLQQTIDAAMGRRPVKPL